MCTLAEMKSEVILIISERPLFCEALKRLIEEETGAEVITAPDEESGESIAAEAGPSIIVIDRPHTKADDVVYFLRTQDKPAKVLVIGWSDDKLAIYSRRTVLSATVQNLIEVIREGLIQ